MRYVALVVGFWFVIMMHSVNVFDVDIGYCLIRKNRKMTMRLLRRMR
jgi:hypothetical protein